MPRNGCILIFLCPRRSTTFLYVPAPRLFHILPQRISNIALYEQTTITHSQGCSPDLFSRADDIPDLSAYDYAILDSKDPEIQLNIVNPLAGTWYFGVVSNNGNCSFDITVGLQTICPNNCSGHGQCDTASGRCICEEHWKTNQDCSLKIQSTKPPHNTFFHVARVFQTYSVLIFLPKRHAAR